jgi:hypothetical protein
MAITLVQARAAKKEAKLKLAHIPQIVGIGLTMIGNDYGLKVNLRAAPRVKLPASIAGVPLQAEVVGTIRKQS